MGDIKNLLTELNDLKPKGWSVVWRDGRISVRPDNRKLGKFVISHRNDTFTVGFFSNRDKKWIAYNYFPSSESICRLILQWMKAEYHKGVSDLQGENV
ncbi:MAG: hypothetical protein JW720_02660 [Sedimentisphaerales bacterium]|nr:hypothetical protein [Sedimentisphaerales bacterium]